MMTPETTQARARWMSLLAKAPFPTLEQAATQVGPLPKATWLRKPETGLAMVRARAGGTGEQFNLGEMSVTRCALSIEGGAMGVAYVAGRNVRHAELAAMFDALLQTDAHDRIAQIVLQPIEQELAVMAARSEARARSTKVEFMTMARGED